MDRFALLAMLRAKPGKEREVEEFLVSARPIVLNEMGTVSWYAVKFDDGQYGIFDTFSEERMGGMLISTVKLRGSYLREQRMPQNLLWLRCWRYSPPKVRVPELAQSGPL